MANFSERTNTLKLDKNGRIKPGRHNRGFIYSKTEGKCTYCGMFLPPFSKWHIDHLIPRHHQDEIDKLENLWPACARCNINKGNLSLDEFREVIIESALSRIRGIEGALAWLQGSYYLAACDGTINNMVCLLVDLRKTIRNTDVCFLIDSLI